MRDHTWFVLTLRVVGVVLIALGLPHAIDFIRDFCEFVFGDWANMVLQGKTIPTFLIVAFGGFSQLALGLYLAFGGKWFIRRCLRQVAWKCNLCGYDCRDITSGRCPECGYPLPGSAAPAADSASR